MFVKVETAYRKLKDKFEIERKLAEYNNEGGDNLKKSIQQQEKESQSADDDQSNGDVSCKTIFKF